MTTRAAAAGLLLVLALLETVAHADDPAPRNFAGSIQLDYLAVPTTKQARELTLDGATIELSMKLNIELSKTTSASVKVCFACHGFEVGMAFVEFRATDELHVRAGRFTPSFGGFPARHDPANHRLSDKPLPYDMGRMIRRDDWNEGVLPAPWVDNGIELGGTRFYEHGQLDYALFVMGGPKAAADAVDFDFIESRSPGQYYVDNNSQPIFGGRLGGSIELGESATLAVGGSAMAGTYDPEAKLKFALAGVDLVLDLRSLILRAEYLIRYTEMSLGADPATRFKFGPGADGRFADYFLKDGFYVEGEVPIGRVDVLARFDGLRRSGNVLATSTLDDNSSLYRATGGTAIRIGKARLKSSVEVYRSSDFDTEVGVHLGLATAF